MTSSGYPLNPVLESSLNKLRIWGLPRRSRRSMSGAISGRPAALRPYQISLPYLYLIFSQSVCLCVIAAWSADTLRCLFFPCFQRLTCRLKRNRAKVNGGQKEEEVHSTSTDMIFRELGFSRENQKTEIWRENKPQRFNVLFRLSFQSWLPLIHCLSITSLWA